MWPNNISSSLKTCTKNRNKKSKMIEPLSELCTYNLLPAFWAQKTLTSFSFTLLSPYIKYAMTTIDEDLHKACAKLRTLFFFVKIFFGANFSRLQAYIFRQNISFQFLKFWKFLYNLKTFYQTFTLSKCFSFWNKNLFCCLFYFFYNLCLETVDIQDWYDLVISMSADCTITSLDGLLVKTMIFSK